MSRHYYTYAQQPYYGGRALGEDVVSTTEVTTTTTEESGTDWVEVGMQAADKLYEWWESSQDKKAAEEAARKAERDQKKADREAQRAKQEAEAARAAEEREGRRRTQREEDLQVLDVYNKAVAAAKANKLLVGGGMLVVSAALIYVAMRRR
jgi:hypothetical protein